MHTYEFLENIPLSTNTHLSLLMSAFFIKKYQHWGWDELGIPNLGRMSLMKCYWMLQSTRITAFTVFELLRENTQWEKGQITVQPCSQFFGTCRYLTKSFFQKKLNRTWLLLIKMVKTSWMMSCRKFVRKPQNAIEL